MPKAPGGRTWGGWDAREVGRGLASCAEQVCPVADRRHSDIDIDINIDIDIDINIDIDIDRYRRKGEWYVQQPKRQSTAVASGWL